MANADADALREALLVAAVEAETDPDWVCNSYHPSLWPALKAARTALASAAQRDLLRHAEPPTDWDGCNFYERTELIK